MSSQADENSPGWVAHAALLFRGEPVRHLLVPLRRSFVPLREIEEAEGGR
jgi:hypothetical protein